MKLCDVRDADLVRVYIGLRDGRAKRKTAYEAEDAGDKTKQDRIETEFMRRFNERGLTSVSAKGVGTAYKSTRTSATVGQWEALLAYVQEVGAWELIEHRVNKTAVDQFRAANDDLPPGVNWSESVTVNFTRA